MSDNIRPVPHMYIGEDPEWQVICKTCGEILTVQCPTEEDVPDEVRKTKWIVYNDGTFECPNHKLIGTT